MSDISTVSSNLYSSYANYRSTAAKNFISSQKAEEEKAAAAVSGQEEEAGAVFEKSDDSTVTAANTYKPNEALKAQLQADLDAQVQNMRSIVEKLISGQGKAYSLAEDSDDIWKFFAEGDFSGIDDAAKAQAQKDIEKGGYWSVDETAGRILDFAKSLTGGDPDKIDTMIDAFKQGYEQATKAWGKDLPEISSKTYDAVMKGFDSWKEEAGVSA